MPKNVLRFVAVSAVLVSACSKTETAKVDTSAPSATPAPAPSTSASTAPAADSLILVRGAIASVTATQVVVKTDSATVTVNTPQPVHVFTRGPSDLSRVTPNSFIGVTTVKQPDGTEKATEIHIFPDELRGLGEGSRMMNPPAGGSGSAGRMTNGAVSGSKMTNGATSTMTNGSAGAKMSNGAVSTTNGTTLVVSFAGGTTTATVPPKTPVTEIKPTDKKLAAGDQVVVVATKGADGNLSSQKVLLSK